MTIVIFGGAGDLAQRKLLPALYNVHVDGLLPQPLTVLAVGRKPLDDDRYRTFARNGVEQFSRRPLDGAKWESFARSLHFHEGDLEAASTYDALKARLEALGEPAASATRVYYLAVPPSVFIPIVRHLAEARLAGDDAPPDARLVVEKPIGHDLTSALAINEAIARVFEERQIFRIDHYLGKETVQNILVLRFANSLFEPLYNHKYIDHLQITVAEEEGVGSRAGYYEQAGALRDMVQNHLLQVLALVAMEPPFSLDPEGVRDEKLQVIQSLRPFDEEAVERCVVRGQYEGYRSEPGVAPGSTVETFVALQVFVDNWRWAGVPFFVRTGKRLAARTSTISIVLKDVPPVLFNRDARHRLEPDVLTIRIQPNEGFALGISSKVPGPKVKITPVEMDFDYCRAFRTTSPEAYERLLLDVMAGDGTLFMRRDAVEAAWRWIMPVLERWSKSPPPLPTYVPGAWGPPEADALIERNRRKWRDATDATKNLELRIKKDQ
jgi:glucose-6-phosphate 1-dehydrogenase